MADKTVSSGREPWTVERDGLRVSDYSVEGRTVTGDRIALVGLSIVNSRTAWNDIGPKYRQLLAYAAEPGQGGAQLTSEVYAYVLGSGRAAHLYCKDTTLEIDLDYEDKGVREALLAYVSLWAGRNGAQNIFAHNLNLIRSERSVKHVLTDPVELSRFVLTDENGGAALPIRR